MKGVYVFFADGFEDIEAIAPVDILHRGGVEVKTVSLGAERSAKSSRGLQVATNLAFREFEAELFRQETAGEETSDRDFLIFPGGMPGAGNLASCNRLMMILERHLAAGGAVAAICAAPALVLSPRVNGVRMTCHDNFAEVLEKSGNTRVTDGVVRDGRIITGRGAGLSIRFGLEILRAIKGDECVSAVAGGMMLDSIGK